MKPDLGNHFPSFSNSMEGADLEQVLTPRSDEEIAGIETDLGISLPDSYKQFLRICGGLWLFGGSVQFGAQHPFFHNYPPLSELSSIQQRIIEARGGLWPPPSDGMLCFAEYFLEADGDQVLFDVGDGLKDGEYPVCYYAHSAAPAKVTRVANSFGEWLEERCIPAFAGK